MRLKQFPDIIRKRSNYELDFLKDNFKDAGCEGGVGELRLTSDAAMEFMEGRGPVPIPIDCASTPRVVELQPSPSAEAAAMPPPPSPTTKSWLDVAVESVIRSRHPFNETLKRGREL